MMRVALPNQRGLSAAKDDDVEGGSMLSAGLESEATSEEVMEVEYEHVDEDTYGAGFTALVKDSYWFYRGTSNFGARCTQLFASMALQCLTIALQAALIYELQSLVSSRAVHHARKIYDHYEAHMYGANNTYLTPYGWRRGTGGMHGPYFRKENFYTLDPDLQEEICSMPISQPIMFSIVLLIWTLVVMNNLKTCLEFQHRMLWVTPTGTVDNMLQKGEDNVTNIVACLPLSIKFLVVLLIGAPRVGMNCVLLWRGTRWLASTMDFNELLLNAIALEFILLLKDLLYVVVISDRNKRETQNLKILPRHREDAPDVCKYLETYAWLGLAILYVYLYFKVLLQFVLPDYNWDIHDTCQEYVANVTKV
mmetsp:Transcript_112189/g.350789  ORF Transcript_112189/g.350789 Transcript_112189/m.350789 type:complete len:365 (-) Transcript_112189:55-1149(-)